MAPRLPYVDLMTSRPRALWILLGGLAVALIVLLLRRSASSTPKPIEEAATRSADPIADEAGPAHHVAAADAIATAPGGLLRTPARARNAVSPDVQRVVPTTNA